MNDDPKSAERPLTCPMPAEVRCFDCKCRLFCADHTVERLHQEAPKQMRRHRAASNKKTRRRIARASRKRNRR